MFRENTDLQVPEQQEPSDMPDGESAYRILHVEDEEEFRLTVHAFLTAQGYEVDLVADGVEAINAVQSRPYDLVLLDLSMPKVSGVEVLEFLKEQYPRIEVIVITASSDLKIAVDCMKKGAFHFITKPIQFGELEEIVKRAVEHRELLQQNTAMRSEIERIGGGMELVGTSQAFRDILALAERVAPAETSVLIQGASGTGKELIANHIHRKSRRSGKPFVAINCASIPDTLIESELFGHEKGAFTDAASQKQGLVEFANRGTLFLDEVGDISAVIQPKLLRFIQTGEFRRIGGNTVLRSDVRIISATNKDLRKEVAENRFRDDLLYRLNVFTLQIPPLRERKDDIPPLVENFLSKRSRSRVRKRLSREAMEKLLAYDWPGNVRELENVLESAAVLSREDVIEPGDLLVPPAAPARPARHEASPGFIGLTMSLRETERLQISAVLKQVKWDKKAAAVILGISLKTLYTKIAQYNLKVE